MRNRHQRPILGVMTAAIFALAGCAGGPSTGSSTLPAPSGAQRSAAQPLGQGRRAPFGALVSSHRPSQGASWMSAEAARGPVAYVADFGDNVVDVYSRKTLGLVGQLETGIAAPYGLTTGPDGSLYVAEQDFTNVAVYARAATRPKLVLVDTSSPYAAAVGADGTVYVSVGYGVDVFAKGNAFPSYTIIDPGFAVVWAVGLDAAGNLYAGGQSTAGGGQVIEYAPGSHGPGTNLNLKRLGLPTTIVFDRKGNLIVGDYDVSTIDVFPQGKTSPSIQVHAPNLAYLATESSARRAWVPTYGGATVNVVSYPSGNVSQSIDVTGNAVQLTGVALSTDR